MNTSTLDQYVHIYRALERRELEHDQFVGWLQLDATVCDQLKELSEKDLTPGTYSARVGGIDGTDLDSLPLDSVDERHFTQDVWIKVEIAARNIRHECSIYSNWSDLLSFPSNLSDPVQRVFFVGDGTGDGHLLAAHRFSLARRPLRTSSGVPFLFLLHFGDRGHSDPENLPEPPDTKWIRMHL